MDLRKFMDEDAMDRLMSIPVKVDQGVNLRSLARLSKVDPEAASSNKVHRVWRVATLLIKAHKKGTAEERKRVRWGACAHGVSAELVCGCSGAV